jgi:hypothetical protein
METIVITPTNKQAIPFLKHLLSSLKEVEKVKVIKPATTSLEKDLLKGLQQAKEIATGRQKGKTLNELLNED